jgi:DNA ligase-1
MKAPSRGISLEELKALRYPVACSAKLDGIRAVMTPSGVMSASLKPLGNQYVQACLNDSTLLGLDGELIVGLPHQNMTLPHDDVFNRTTGAIRRIEGEPDFKFYVFDNFINKKFFYRYRWINLCEEGLTFSNPRVVILEQRICYTWQEALAYEAELIGMGYEGMMVRSLIAEYKEGRVTINEAYILKRKPLEQSEGIVVGIYEQQQNLNEKITNELGRGQRSSHKENKVGKGTLGGVTLRDRSLWKEDFNCGTIIGGTDAWRQDMFDHPEKIMGATMTYIYQACGSINKPRQPRAKAEFRLSEDITEY